MMVIQVQSVLRGGREGGLYRQAYTHNTPVMCNIGQYPLFCGHWARQLALKYINCGQSSLYKNHLTEKVEHYLIFSILELVDVDMTHCDSLTQRRHQQSQNIQ